MRKKRWRETAAGRLEPLSDEPLEFAVHNSKTKEEVADAWTLRVHLQGIQRTEKPNWSGYYYVRASSFLVEAQRFACAL